MKVFGIICTLLTLATAAQAATGSTVSYKVNGQPYEGYYVSPSDNAPLVFLIHDW